MENKLKQERRIEWSFNNKRNYNAITDSECFSFQGRKCNFRYECGNSYADSRLLFMIDVNLQSPVTVRLRVKLNSEVIYEQEKTIAETNQNIWDYATNSIPAGLMTIEIVFNAACSIGEFLLKVFFK